MNKNVRLDAYHYLRSLFVFAVIGLGFYISSTMAAVDTYQFDTVDQSAQYSRLIQEFRCPTCQNQNLASSNAPIAVNLKQMIYQQVMQGRSDDDIRSELVNQYGDFITYNPPLNAQTSMLWFLPPLFLVLMIGCWVWSIRQQRFKSNKHTEAHKQ